MAQDFVEKVRRRPTKTSTNGALAWKAFGDNPRIAIPIPRIFDDYNKYMGGVDIANQPRELYKTHGKTFRVWFPLFYWLIDAAITNAYRLQYLSKKAQGVPEKELLSQIDFRQALYKRLFAFQGRSLKRSFNESLPSIRLNTTIQHEKIRRLKCTGCIWCRYINGQKRRKYVVDALNHTPEIDNDNMGKRAKQTIYGCRACDVALCRNGSC
jgi:Transposase IS4